VVSVLKESDLQLLGKPKLNNIIYETNRDFEIEGPLPLEISNDIRIIKDADEQTTEAIVVLKIDIFAARELAEVPLKLSIEIEGCFKWTNELQENKELLDILLRQNAPAILYSYLRPIITLITVEANLPPLVLPLINFLD
jgi:preprotein translocase subunit SecB